MGIIINVIGIRHPNNVILLNNVWHFKMKFLVLLINLICHVNGLKSIKNVCKNLVILHPHMYNLNKIVNLIINLKENNVLLKKVVVAE